MTAPGNRQTEPVTPLVQIRRGNDVQQSMSFGADERLPPATRAECPTERPCPRTLCRHNTTIEHETAGRQHRGVHNKPHKVRQAAGLPSCDLDAIDAQPVVEPAEQRHESIPVEVVAKTLGVTPRRVQQVQARGLVKEWVAYELVQAVDDFAERVLLPQGATLEHRWGVIADENGQLLQRAHDVDRVVVTLVVNVKRAHVPAEVPPVFDRKPRAEDPLRARREALGLLLSDVAREVGLSVQQLAEYERGATRCPDAVRLKLTAVYVQREGR